MLSLKWIIKDSVLIRSGPSKIGKMLFFTILEGTLNKKLISYIRYQYRCWKLVFEALIKAIYIYFLSLCCKLTPCWKSSIFVKMVNFQMSLKKFLINILSFLFFIWWLEPFISILEMKSKKFIKRDKKLEQITFGPSEPQLWLVGSGSTRNFFWELLLIDS